MKLTKIALILATTLLISESLTLAPLNEEFLVAEPSVETILYKSKHAFKKYLIKKQKYLDGLVHKEHKNLWDKIKITSTLVAIKNSVKKNLSYFDLKSSVCKADYGSLIVRTAYTLMDAFTNKAQVKGDLVAYSRIMGWIIKDCL